MKRTAMGVFAGLMLGAPALAQAPSPPPAVQEEGARGEQRELTARVLGSGDGYLYLESAQGPVIPMRVTHATRITGRRIPRSEAIPAWLRRELEPGQPLRVRFDVRVHPDGTPENVAGSIDPP